jgi:hypothetical protein
MELQRAVSDYCPIVEHAEGNEVTTATLEDHLAARGVDTAGLYSRGARVQRRVAAAADIRNEPTEFVAVRVESPAEPTPEPRRLLCCITHISGQVLEFAEWPDASWLAALMGAMAGPAR